MPLNRRIDRALWVMGATLLGLLAWDASGADRAVMAWFGGPAGFPWREDAWARQAYAWGRHAVALGAVLLLVQLLWPQWRPCSRGATIPVVSPPWSARWAWLGVAVAGWLLVLALKRLSLTSCPWELAEFGGVAQAVSHWRWGVPDEGPGRCFPSGHASGGYALLAGWVAFRGRLPGRARAWLWAALVMGTVMGLTQVVRGAHHPSHVAWAAWLCAAVCLACAWLHRRRWPEPVQSATTPWRSASAPADRLTPARRRSPVPASNSPPPSRLW